MVFNGGKKADRNLKHPDYAAILFHANISMILFNETTENSVQ